jgi:hypothetical protein
MGRHQKSSKCQKEYLVSKYSYRSRENCLIKRIQTQKLRINAVLGFWITQFYKPGQKILILDSINENTRKMLHEYDIPDNNIITIDRECENPGLLRKKCELDEYLDMTKIIFSHAWLDAISGFKKTMTYFKKFIDIMGTGPNIVGVTISSRGRKKGQSFKSWERWAEDYCNERGLHFERIDLSDELRLKKEFRGKLIPKNWSYNKISRDRGGVFTAFFKIT